MATPPKPWERKQTQLNSSTTPDEIITPSQSPSVPTSDLPTRNHLPNGINLDSAPALGDLAADGATSSNPTTSTIGGTTGLGSGSYGGMGGGYGGGYGGGMGMGGGMYGRGMGMGMGGMYGGGMGMGGMYGGGMGQ
jgi:peroxin-13